MPTTNIRAGTQKWLSVNTARWFDVFKDDLYPGLEQAWEILQRRAVVLKQER
jgi:hypothetical protein